MRKQCGRWCALGRTRKTMGRAYPRGGAPGSTGQEKAVTIVSPYAAIESRHWETPASDGQLVVAFRADRATVSDRDTQCHRDGTNGPESSDSRSDGVHDLPAAGHVGQGKGWGGRDAHLGGEELLCLRLCPRQGKPR
jgi:hypothetical protein